MSNVLGLRIEDDLMAAIERAAKVRSQAEGREVKKSEVAVEILEGRLGPRVPKEIDGMPVLKLSVSEVACLDQLAGRAGVTRAELIGRYLAERLRREFIAVRNGTRGRAETELIG
jgi:hypothetical protein